MAKKQIVSNKTAESAPVSPLIVDNVDALKARMAEVRAAQQEFATFTQEQVDKIFQAAAIAANQMRIPLAKMAVEETGMGVVKIRLSRTTTQPSTSTTLTRTQRPATLSKKTRLSVQ